LRSNPKWSPGRPLPVSLEKLTAAAEAELPKHFGIDPQKISTISLTHVAIVDQWFVVVEFDATDFSGQGEPSERRIPLVVLLDGRVILPKAN